MNDDSVFKALADPTRRLIIEEFSDRPERTLFELCARLITKHQVAISRQAVAKHISILEEAGLIRSKRRGKLRVLYFNKDPITEIVGKWVANM